MTLDKALQRTMAVLDVRLAERRRDLEQRMFLDGLDAQNIAAVMEQQRQADVGTRADLINKMTAALSLP